MGSWSLLSRPRKAPSKKVNASVSTFIELKIIIGNFHKILILRETNKQASLVKSLPWRRKVPGGAAGLQNRHSHFSIVQQGRRFSDKSAFLFWYRVFSRSVIFFSSCRNKTFLRPNCYRNGNKDPPAFKDRFSTALLHGPPPTSKKILIFSNFRFAPSTSRVG